MSGNEQIRTQRRLTWRRLSLISVCIVFVLYIGSFAVLAMFGGYMPLASGHFRPFRTRLASGDTWIWQPRYGTFAPFRNAFGEDEHMADTLGYIYSPLICLHQRFFRPSIRFILPDGSSVTPSPRMPSRTELHPTTLQVLAQMEREYHFTYEASK